MTLQAGSPQLRVEISVENVGAIGRTAGYWSQSLVYPGGVSAAMPTVFRPNVRAISVSTYDKATERFTFSTEEPDTGFVRDPQKGWMATLNAETRTGMAFVMSFDELMFLYNCMPYTNEWQYKSVGIPVGKAWKTDFVLYPINGFTRVDYASRTMLAAVQPPMTTAQ